MRGRTNIACCPDRDIEDDRAVRISFNARRAPALGRHMDEGVEGRKAVRHRGLLSGGGPKTRRVSRHLHGNHDEIGERGGGQKAEKESEYAGVWGSGLQKIPDRRGVPELRYGAGNEAPSSRSCRFQRTIRKATGHPS